MLQKFSRKKSYCLRSHSHHRLVQCFLRRTRSSKRKEEGKKKTKGAVLLLHHGHVRNSEFLVQRDNVPVRVLDLPRGSDAWPRAEW